MNEFKEKMSLKNSDDCFKARIEFDGQMFLIFDNFVYNGNRYFYIIEDKSEELQEAGSIENFDGKIRIEFIHKKDNDSDLYETITDKELLNALFLEVGKRYIENK